MHNEQVFTPEWIVNEMLDTIPYTGLNIRKRHIMDNSCGDGRFLCEVARRYVRQCRLDGIPMKKALKEFGRYVHGVEIDSELRDECENNVKGVLGYEAGEDASWLRLDIVCGDSLYVHTYDHKMDYVVGNPPYCNVHHMKDRKRIEEDYRFARGGMTDLYLVFFEVGIRMMKPRGKLVYITPSSWINSVAGQEFRDWLIKTNKLSGVVDFKGERIFDGVTTFSMITFLDGAKRKKDDVFSLIMYDRDVKDFRCQMKCHLKDCLCNGRFLFCEGDMAQMVKDMQEPSYDCGIRVKNGYATNKDKLFIMDGETDEDSNDIIPVIKASTGQRMYMYYPYDETGKPKMDEELDFTMYCHMTEKAKGLGYDPKEDGWNLFGRTQALGDTYTDKVSCSNLVGSDGNMHIAYAEGGCGVFAGLYVLDTMNYMYETGIGGIIGNPDIWDGFVEYAKALAHWKSGGYMAFTSKELERWINYKLAINTQKVK